MSTRSRPGPGTWAVGVLAAVSVVAVGLVVTAGGDSGAGASAPASSAAPAPAGAAGLGNVNVARPRAVWIGDIWSSGINGGGSSHGLAAEASRALGWDWQLLMQPQTGWASGGIKGVAGLNGPFTDRVDAAIALQPRIVVLNGGATDAARNVSGPDLKTAVRTTVTRLRAGLPADVPIVIMGPAWPETSVPTVVADVATRITAVAGELDVPYVDPLGEGWLTAANLATAVKAGHLTVEGNRALADRFVADVERLGVRVTAG